MITAKQVNELRQRTAVGMMLCKKALEATNGDQDLAVEWIRKNWQGNIITDTFTISSKYNVTTFLNGNIISTVEVPSGNHYSVIGNNSVIDLVIDENTKPTFTIDNRIIKIVKA